MQEVGGIIVIWCPAQYCADNVLRDSKMMKYWSVKHAYPNRKLVGNESQYDHAQEFLKTSDVETFGTLTKDDWEALTIYVIFAFKKIQ